MCFFFKQKTAYEMRMSDWSSDVCSSDLLKGQIYAGYADGRVMRFDEDGAHPVLLANTGGRPLGISVGDKGVFVAGARRGLLQIKADGSVEIGRASCMERVGQYG